MALVTVKPLPRTSWHNKSGKDSFTRDKSFHVLVDANTHKYATGLTEEEAIELGKQLGLDLSDTFMPDMPHPYWSTNASKITLTNSVKVYDTSKPMDYIKVANMKACKFVANSIEEFNKGMYPYATHVIYDETKEIETKAVIVNKKRTAYNLLLNMSLEKKQDIIQIILNKNARKQSISFVDVLMDNILENHIDEFISLANSNSDKIRMKAVILEALYLNTLTTNAGSIYYMGQPLATSVDDAVEYFLNPNNQNHKISILGKILGKISNKNITVESVATAQMVNTDNKETIVDNKQAISDKQEVKNEKVTESKSEAETKTDK